MSQSEDHPHVPKQPVSNASADQIARFVTSIKNPAQQIGEHIVAALQHADTVAVLTTVVVGPGGQQHIVSAALNPKRTAQINELLMNAEEEREEEVLCVGFHCLLRPKHHDPEQAPEQSPEQAQSPDQSQGQSQGSRDNG